MQFQIVVEVYIRLLFKIGFACFLTIVGKLSNKVTPRPSKGTTVTIHELVHVSSYQQRHKKDCMDDIKHLMRSLALIYCGSSSMSLRDDSSGQIVMSSGRTKTLSGQ